MDMEERAAIDQKVLDHLQSIHGSTAWAMTGAIGRDRVTVSKSLYRLKRKGLVRTSEVQTTFWMAVKP